MRMHEADRGEWAKARCARVFTRKRQFAMLLPRLVFLGLVFVGCGAKHQNETIAGVSVPIPSKMKQLARSEDKINLGPGQKGEQVSFFGEVSRAEVITFYQDVLPVDNWEPHARLGKEIGGFAFTRGDQTLLIRITENTPKTSTLTVLVKSSRQSASLP